VKWLVGLLVLVALLVGADRVAEHVAAGVLADRLQTELGSRPTVEIDGFPFLTQAVGGSYQRLRVSAPVVRREGLSLRDFSATLTGVHVALGDALGGSLSAVPVDRLDAGALVAYDDLTQLAGPGLRLAGDPNGVRVTGRVAALGRQVDVSAVSSVALAGDTLVVTAGRLTVDGVAVTGPLAAALRGRLDLRVPLPALPYGVRLASLVAGPQGITVSGSARSVVLRP